MASANWVDKTAWQELSCETTERGREGGKEREVNLNVPEKNEIKALYCPHLINDFGKLLQSRAHDLIVTGKRKTLWEREGQSLIIKLKQKHQIIIIFVLSQFFLKPFLYTNNILPVFHTPSVTWMSGVSQRSVHSVNHTNLKITIFRNKYQEHTIQELVLYQAINCLPKSTPPII